MPITRIARETVWVRARKNKDFRESMLVEAINEMLAGDFRTSKAMLSDYVNATITFDRLAERLNKPSKNLQRMLGPRGNPTAESLFGIIKILQASERIRLAVKTTRRAA